jgi:membrane protease YdiL (CAAX protease family)
MTIEAAVAPLAAYAVVVQTLVYAAVPARLRINVAPVITAMFGAVVVVGAGLIFGVDRIGLTGGSAGVALVWGSMTLVVVAAVGTMMMTSETWRGRLADPRLAGLTRRQTITQVLVRIPVCTALIEEAFFRGVLHAALIALYPSEAAIWLGAGLFGLWHVAPGLEQARSTNLATRATAIHSVATFVVTTMAGVFLVWLRIETGSIWAPVAVHAIVNATLAMVSRSAARRPAAAPGRIASV